ncbi:hypothetical protein Slin15195_G073000 [Septoria linicola]|uniref:RRM domain-containing protein n=1 Tax=Septoria linicola TaxID=215465 RepID=A0A9Q9B0C4_9PEZI|nr:hypothetical protein Slin15195_G073000 [Septoria linicola]
MATLARPTAGRAVHLRITPRPSSLGESREILRLISQFGEVEHFKNLKYDALSMPNAALVIFKDEDAAVHCMKKSPIRFRMGKAPVEEQGAADFPSPPPVQESSAPPATRRDATPPPRPGGAWGLGQMRAMSTHSSYTPSNTLPTPPSRPPQMPFQAPPLPLLESRIFQIQTNWARTHFRDQINMGHYHGTFALDKKSIPQSDLSQTVPLAGLSCVNWRKEDKPWRIMDKEKAQERTGPNRRKSLMELYEQVKEGHEALRDEASPG